MLFVHVVRPCCSAGKFAPGDHILVDAEAGDMVYRKATESAA